MHTIPSENHSECTGSVVKCRFLKISKRRLVTAGIIALTGITVSLLVIQFGHGDSRVKFDGMKYFGAPSRVLLVVRYKWIDQGRPTDFEPNKGSSGSFSDVFFYTNAIRVDGKLYQGRFALYNDIWPPGHLIICDDATVLWIRARDGKIVVDPVHKVIEP